MSFGILFKDDVRAWLRPRSLALVLVACLVPPGLTAAWVFTHQADVEASAITFEPQPPVGGALVNITASFHNGFSTTTRAFNVTLQVGFFENRTGQLSFRAVKEQAVPLAGLGPGATATATMNWTAQAGTFIFRALADTADALPELEERNNENYVQVHVPFATILANLPRPPVVAGNATLPPADLALQGLTWGPPELYASKANTLHVRVRNLGPNPATNATVSVSIHGATPFGYDALPADTLTGKATLGPGNETTVDLRWTPPAVNQYALLASVRTPEQTDGNASNDAVIQQAFIDREFLYQAPPPKATARDFYRSTLEDLHLKLLIPLVALFYAAGLVEQERSRGSLAYLLTRPVPRWQIPVARFAAMLVVAMLAIVTGLVATYILLLGLPQGAGGQFALPLLFSVAALAAYGALFTAIGVASRRPYLVSLVYLLGLETLLLLGRSVLVNGRPLVQDWVAGLSLTEWMLKAFRGWNGTAWLPAGNEAMQGLAVMAGVTVVGLAAAALMMKRREFEP